MPLKTLEWTLEKRKNTKMKKSKTFANLKTKIKDNNLATLQSITCMHTISQISTFLWMHNAEKNHHIYPQSRRSGTK